MFNPPATCPTGSPQGENDATEMSLRVVSGPWAGGFVLG